MWLQSTEWKIILPYQIASKNFEQCCMLLHFQTYSCVCCMAGWQLMVFFGVERPDGINCNFYQVIQSPRRQQFQLNPAVLKMRP
jgi:hypothetical protein